MDDVDDVGFVALVEPVPAAVAAEMVGVSWHEGCPVPIGELRLVTMDHWGFDGAVRRGELVVHAAVAADVASVFGRLFAQRFPIARMERVESYGGDDDASMAADNTSAFNCREITGGGSFSVHSWGMAIDVNTVENPYVRGSTVLPPAGADFLDRGDVRPGMITAGDAVVEAFAAAGFDWGGSWSSLQDYQHFEIGDPEARVAEYRGQADAAAAVAPAPCSPAPPDSSAWTGRLDESIDLADGRLDPGPLNDVLVHDAHAARSPCDAARILLHLDGPAPARTTVVDVEPVIGGAVVTVTLDGMLDDSVAAVRYVLEFAGDPGGPLALTSGTWSQRCQPGRGHQELTAGLCV